MVTTYVGHNSKKSADKVFTTLTNPIWELISPRNVHITHGRRGAVSLFDMETVVLVTRPEEVVSYIH